MRYFLAVSLLFVAAMTSCASAPKNKTAEERAGELNAEKTRAQELMDANDFRAAIDVLEPLSRKASADHQLFLMMGKAYAGLGEYDNAVKNFEQSIRLSYTDYHPHLELATLLMQNGRIGRALTEFEEAARYGARDPLTRYNYGLALYRMGKRQQALEQWRRAFEMESDNPRYAEAVGIALKGVDDEEAVQYFDKAASLGASGAQFHNNYGLALQSVGRFRQARVEFEAALGAEPGNEDYGFNLAALYTLARSYGDALAAWDALIARNGPHWSYLVYRAGALSELGRFEESIACLEAAAAAVEAKRPAGRPELMDRNPPGLGDAFETLAMSYRGMGRLDRALDYIRKAVDLEPHRVSFLNNYGVILAESGNIGEAKAKWRAVLEIDANNKTAKENLSALER